MKNKAGFDKLISETKAFIVVNKKRSDLGLNLICPNCGRVMKRFNKSKYEFKCICNPSVIMSVG